MSALAGGSVRRIEDEELVGDERRDQEYGIGRILAISDGVFAFAMTLLVVDLVIPSGPALLQSQLLSQIPSYISYVISFAAVAATWHGHHQNFRYIQRYDDSLIGLNFLGLLLIAFFPFPTAVLGGDGAGVTCQPRGVSPKSLSASSPKRPRGNSAQGGRRR